MDFVIQCVDEKDLSRRFVPRLLGDRRKRYRLARYLGIGTGPSALDARRPDASELWQRAQKALVGLSAQRALDLTLEMAVLYLSAALPHDDESGPNLTFWNESQPGLPAFDQSPFGRLPQGGLEELFEARPELRKVSPSGDPDVRVFGLYIPPGSVPSVLAWLRKVTGPLGRAERFRFERIEVALAGCAQNNWGYWETAGVPYERAFRFQRPGRPGGGQWEVLAPEANYSRSRAIRRSLSASGNCPAFDPSPGARESGLSRLSSIASPR